jgi:hypothetical protein
MWNQLLLSGRNASGFSFGTATVYQVIWIFIKFEWSVVGLVAAREPARFGLQRADRDAKDVSP